MAFIDYAGETEEERRRRLEQEAAAAAMNNEPVGSGGSYPSSSGFGDIMGAYVDKRLGDVGNRISQFGQYFTDPEAAMQRRLGMQAEAANTEVQSQTVKTYGDGSQEQIVKTQRPAPQAEVTGPAVPQPAAPAPVAQAPAPVAPAVPGQESRPQVFPAFAQAVQQNAARPAAPAIPPEAATQAVAMPPMPQPGPPVQVASTDPAAGLQAAAAARAQQQAQQVATQAPAVTPSLQQQAQTMPAAAPAPAPEVPWVGAANDAGNDFSKLVDVAAKYPESRGAIQEKLKNIIGNQRKADEAEKIVRDAQSGDPKAMNKLEQSLRPDRGRAKEEVGVTDYLKLYMYHRLGLGNTELAKELDQKISGTATKFGQVQLGSTNWSVETDNKTGQIIRARDDEGNIATQNTINKLAAAGQKFGTHAYSQTGEIHNTPDGKQVVKVFNATTGKPQWTDIDSGDKWTGKGIPQPQSIATQMAKMDYGVISDYRKKFGTDKLAAVDQARKDGVIKSPNDEAAFLDRWNFAGGVPGFGGPGAAVPAAAAPAQAPPPLTVPGQRPPQAPATAGPVAPTPVPAAAGARPGQAPALVTSAMPVQGATMPGAGGAGSPPQRGATEAENVYKNRLADWEKRRNVELDVEKARREEEQKKIGAAAGTAQAGDVTKAAQAREVYAIAGQINSSLQKATGSGIGAKVDDVAAWFGKSTEGAKATAELKVLGDRILKSVPRFEGPQSDVDVQSYKDAAGALADPRVPVESRVAAFKVIVDLNKKYYPDLDWTFSQPAGGNIRIIKREKVR